MKNLCVIAGRAGSKRLPGKNLIDLCGKPLIAYSVEQAKLSAICTHIAVSSDSDEILNAGKEYGADLLIKRPAELATDEANSFDVILHAVSWAESKTTINYDNIIFLQITSPLRIASDIKAAMKIFSERKNLNLLSVTKTKTFGVEVIDGKTLKSADFGKEKYQINGAIYIWDKAKFMAAPQHLYADTRLMLMPQNRSIDIDYKVDIDTARSLMESGEYLKGESVAVN